MAPPLSAHKHFGHNRSRYKCFRIQLVTCWWIPVFVNNYAINCSRLIDDLPKVMTWIIFWTDPSVTDPYVTRVWISKGIYIPRDTHLVHYRHKVNGLIFTPVYWYGRYSFLFFSFLVHYQKRGAIIEDRVYYVAKENLINTLKSREIEGWWKSISVQGSNILTSPYKCPC